MIYRRRLGFTLVEMIVVIGVTGLFIALMVRFTGSALPLYRTSYLQFSAQETARLQLRRLVRELREARISDTGAYPIIEALPQRVIVYANVDADSATERVRYELIGTNFVRGITKPSGNPTTYNVTQEVVTTISPYVRNGALPVFTYYDSSYPTTPTPSSSVSPSASPTPPQFPGFPTPSATAEPIGGGGSGSPTPTPNGSNGNGTGTVSLSDIAYIGISLFIDVDTAQNPPQLPVTTQVQLRNLKSNL